MPESTSPRFRDIRYREIRPSDWHRLQCFHLRLSGDTVELRFHGAKRELSTPLAHKFTDLDGHDRVAIVATTGTRGRIVGVARYFTMSPTTAEVAFVVEDAYQGHGIGRKLMERLRKHALENGITEFVAEVMPGNAAMLRILHRTGTCRATYEGGSCEVRVSLVPAPDAVPAG